MADVKPNDSGVNPVFRLRVLFCKRGRAAMLSHLEVARALERVVRRAKLPYAISQGFSPHMKISFGSALPVGVGGLHEYFDVSLTSYVNPEQALIAMRDACAVDLLVESCDYIGARDPAASVAFPFSDYEVRLDKATQVLFVPQTVMVIRKKKERELDVADYLVGQPKLDGRIITFTLEAKSSGSLRPDVLVKAMLEGMPGYRVISITRIRQSN